MRFARLVLSIALASGLLAACGPDENAVIVPRGADGLYAGGTGASPSETERTTDAGADAGWGTDASSSGSSQTVETSAEASAPVADGAIAPTTETDAAVAADAAAELSDGGCACGCADPCLTELIAACKAPTILLLAVCPKVPTTCACQATCTTPEPTPPSLDACVAQFLLTGT